MEKGSLSSVCQMDLQSYSQLPAWDQGLDLDLNHPESQSHRLIQIVFLLILKYQWKLQKEQIEYFYLPFQVVVESALDLKMEGSLFLDEEVYDPLYSSEFSVTDHTLPCSISQGFCYISMKEVRFHDIVQGSLPSECQMDFQSSSQLPAWEQGVDLDLNHPNLNLIN